MWGASMFIKYLYSTPYGRMIPDLTSNAAFLNSKWHLILKDTFKILKLQLTSILVSLGHFNLKSHICKTIRHKTSQWTKHIWFYLFLNVKYSHYPFKICFEISRSYHIMFKSELRRCYFKILPSNRFKTSYLYHKHKYYIWTIIKLCICII